MNNDQTKYYQEVARELEIAICEKLAKIREKVITDTTADLDRKIWLFSIIDDEVGDILTNWEISDIPHADDDFDED